MYVVFCVHATLQKIQSILQQQATVILIGPLLKVWGMSKEVEFLVAKLPRKKNKLASSYCIVV